MNTPVLRAYLDSGPPDGIPGYTTAVILHGYVWHAEIFRKLLPQANAYKARIIAVNRRGYPGSTPFDQRALSTLEQLVDAPVTPANASTVFSLTHQLAKEVYDYLADLVTREHIPAAQGDSGGIVLVGWSFATVYMNAFLAHVSSFPPAAINVREYIRRIIYYDGSHTGLGRPPPPDVQLPLPPADSSSVYNAWLSGYYAHGDVWAKGAAALSFGPELATPSPTTVRMSAAELAESMYEPAGAAGGCDWVLTRACMRFGTYEALACRAFYLAGVGEEGKGDWGSVRVRVVWCDQSEWEMPWGAYSLREELRAARREGTAVRDVEFVRLRGANHFAHWDMPEKTLETFLLNSIEDR